MCRLDDTMHVHVGYYEHGLDFEGVFFKSLETGKWQLFFDLTWYGIKLLKQYEQYADLGLLIGEYSIEDDKIEEEGNQLFEQFLKENRLLKSME
ncbi:DUF3986 family protein [Bacillus altitudinis]|uniref:DUF3986 family protein n=1 Tax=Bacillus altitudinis TaxID=293387 RepID=UPI0011E9560F|nr:DUF3986 family protein [Bacillus altitudinis]TYS29203.1 DUF3986 family protein [Bacillus altitudinis]